MRIRARACVCSCVRVAFVASMRAEAQFERHNLIISANFCQTAALSMRCGVTLTEFRSSESSLFRSFLADFPSYYLLSSESTLFPSYTIVSGTFIDRLQIRQYRSKSNIGVQAKPLRWPLPPRSVSLNSLTHTDAGCAKSCSAGCAASKAVDARRIPNTRTQSR